MTASEDMKKHPTDPLRPPSREIGNANLFADDIVFSNTEKILFEEDLQETPPNHEDMMDGNPAERYSPHKKLSEGGMKTIWEVDDHRTARKVAMALIQDSRIASRDDIDSFLYEARLTANLQHPNIIPIYDIALDENGNPYFTMKALKGETLGEIIKQLQAGSSEYEKCYTRTRLLAIFLKVCDAIDYAHTKGVIHLDLKPSNVIVGDFGDVHVLDWGLSTLITHLNEYDGEAVSWHSMDDVSLENGQTLTRYLEGSAKRRKGIGGTPGYMSPEQAQGAPSDIDFQTDVYALGSMLYEILTHGCPITGNTVKEVLQKTVRADFPDPAKRAPELHIPSALAAIAMKAMQNTPSARYPTVAVLIRDIHQYQDGFATLAENPTFITHATLLIKRHKLAAGLIATSVVIIASILSNSFSSIKTSEGIALDALAELKKKNAYIAQTAATVAPDYLDLMSQYEKNFNFSAAEQSLDTCLAFDPSLEKGWISKGKILLCQQEFSKAWSLLSTQPTQQNSPALRLAGKYRTTAAIQDSALPQLVKDFTVHDLSSGLPRLFYHLNQAPFDPATRFPALAESLRILNPEIKNLHFEWKMDTSKGWIINLSNNPGLDDISPLCGLNIRALNASNIGAPNLALLTGNRLTELDVSGTSLNHLPELDSWAELKVLNLGKTRIRNLNNLVKHPKLTALDISGIEGISIPQHLLWNRSLKLLAVSEAFLNDPTIRMLSQRGVIIIYTNP